MNDRISSALARLFEEHSIVFWPDPTGEMREAYEAVALPGVTRVEVANNEFGLKLRMLRREAGAKFLVYRPGPEPAVGENWLLDVQLSAGQFRADQVAIWLAELGLPAAFEGLVREHAEFFRSGARVEALKRLMRADDTRTALRLRMLAVCAGAQGSLDTVIEALLAELAEERKDAMRLIERAGLAGFLWEQIGAQYGYHSEAPGVEDFAITLFEAVWRLALGEGAKLKPEALVLFHRWKNDRHGGTAFERLSARYLGLLGISENIARREVRDLVGIDHFEEVDRHIIRQIVHGLAAATVSAGEALGWARARRQSHWYGRYEDVYLALGFAVEFQQALAEANIRMTSPAEGVRRYVASWFRLDQLYRKFLYHMDQSRQATLLSELFTTIENRYTTNFLLPLNDAWQDQLARMERWEVPGLPRQIDFYRDQAAEYRRRDQKVVVIISDALRYEVAEECLARIRGLNRFDAELSAMIGVLPSYTQLGMAALLPHDALRIAPDGQGTVLDGEAGVQGLAGRERQLGKGHKGDRVKALAAQDVLNMRTDEGKALFRDHDAVYVYHNRIDAVGDKLATEDHLPEAVESTIEDLVALVRKLTSSNFSNILITADHGFLYQHRPLDESDFSVAEPQGGETFQRNRRFVLGRGLSETRGMKHFTAAQLGLVGDVDVLIPNSINRLRVRGAGSRYVHGGASLQEIVLPVLRVGKHREADLRQVNVQIVTSGRGLITSGQLAVTLYQTEPVSPKVQSRRLFAGIYAGDGTLISDEVELLFDFRSDNPREREQPCKLLLSRAADAYNGQDVLLKLRERVGETSHYQDHASHRLQLRRGIEIDFDF
ncbi:BREX-1 system phosphatase PglZ type A [Roseomonas sp. ACRSG]|nr:BREX-1 system phosphatase PglZ type A [Roseomonas sp. ACRSG]